MVQVISIENNVNLTNVYGEMINLIRWQSLNSPALIKFFGYSTVRNPHKSKTSTNYLLFHEMVAETLEQRMAKATGLPNVEVTQFISNIVQFLVQGEAYGIKFTFF